MTRAALPKTGTGGTEAGGRLVFAHQLRSLAALCVAGSHLVGVFWLMRPSLELATAAPAQGGAPPGIIALFNLPWLNFGPFGVGVFFMISGLVIPLSLDIHTRASFLGARALRIYPVCAAAVLIDVAVLHANAAAWGRPFPYSSGTVWSNALLVYDWLGLPSIDLVNWTLCVEILFYLLMAVVAPLVRRGSVSVLFAAAAALVAFNAARGAGAFGTPVPHAADVGGFYATFLVFMLAGVPFQYHLRGRLGTPGLVATVFGLLAAFWLCWTLGPVPEQLPVVTVNYLYAAGAFGAAYAARRLFRPFRLLDWLAAISFPFYLVHSAVGYAVLKYAMVGRGWSYASALASALACILACSVLVHLLVERPTIQAGKWLAGRRRHGPAPIVHGKVMQESR